jgi:hypothetical protein
VKGTPAMIGTQRYPRLAFAGAVGVVGVIVSLAMVRWGGPNAKYLPDGTFQLGALGGGVMAGWLCVGCFGRANARGWVFALFGSVTMTVLGAVLGATVLNERVYFMRGGMLGLVAIIDAAESPIALGVWLLCMAALHMWAVKLRARGPIPWTGPRD